MKNQEVNKPLQIWIKEDFILPKFRPNPLIMHITQPDTNPELNYWNLLREILPELVIVHKFKDLAEAGPLVVTPNHYKDYIDNLADPRKFQPVRDFNKQVLASGRKLVTFTLGREYKPLPGEIVFAQSTYRSPADKSIPAPAWLFDLGHQMTPIAKPSAPTVGFIGHTEYPGRINSIMRYVPIPHFIVTRLASSYILNQNTTLGMRRIVARWVRKKVMKEVRQATNLKSSLVERKRDFFNQPDEIKKQQRAEYIENIQDNAYTICMRGDNNDNHQMYEVMSASRIPIVIDTNQRFPDLGEMRWEDFCILVPYSELHRIGEIIQGFHDQMSEEKFAERCRKSRVAFETLLPHNFIHLILREIRKYATTTSV